MHTRVRCNDTVGPALYTIFLFLLPDHRTYRMGIQDLNYLFEEVDRGAKGYLTLEEVIAADAIINGGQAIQERHVVMVMEEQFGSREAPVTAQNFGAVLLELRRRRVVEEEMRFVLRLC